MIIMYSLTVRRLRKVLKEFQCKSDNKNHVHLSFRPRVDKVKKRFEIVSFFSPRKKPKSSSEPPTHAVCNGKQANQNWHSTESPNGNQQEHQQLELKRQQGVNENEETECLMGMSNPETTKHTEITITEANKEPIDGQLEAQVKAATAFKTQVDMLRENPRSCLKLSNKVLSKSEQIQPVSSNEMMAQMTTSNHAKPTHLVESSKFISLSLSLRTLSRESKMKGANEVKMGTKTVSINESLNVERPKPQFDLETNEDDSNRSSKFTAET